MVNQIVPKMLYGSIELWIGPHRTWNAVLISFCRRFILAAILMTNVETRTSAAWAFAMLRTIRYMQQAYEAVVSRTGAQQDLHCVSRLLHEHIGGLQKE